MACGALSRATARPGPLLGRPGEGRVEQGQKRGACVQSNSTVPIDPSPSAVAWSHQSGLHSVPRLQLCPRCHWSWPASGHREIGRRKEGDGLVRGMAGWTRVCFTPTPAFFQTDYLFCVSWLLLLLYYFRWSFTPRVIAVARRRLRSFCQKCRWQVFT